MYTAKIDRMRKSQKGGRNPDVTSRYWASNGGFKPNQPCPSAIFSGIRVACSKWWVGQLDGYKHDSGGEGRFMGRLSAHRLLRMAVVASRRDDAIDGRALLL